MNSVQLVGRFTKDPDVRYTDGGMTIARFSLAVDRRFKSDNGPTADFPNLVAFGKTAEFIEKYFRKGMRIGIQGRIQTGSYTNNDGNKVYTTDVVVENCEFVESKGSHNNASGDDSGGFNNCGPADNDGFMNIPDDIDEELPFN